MNPSLRTGPAEVTGNLFFIRQQALLHDINVKRWYPASLIDSQPWRTYCAADSCTRYLLENAPFNCRVLITVTTRCRSKKVSLATCEKFSRILGRHIAPKCKGYVWFFHRNKDGHIHWHICAVLKAPVTDAPEIDEATALALRSLASVGHGMKGAAPLDTPVARGIQHDVSEACKAAGIGHHVHIGIIEAPSRLVPYLTRYLRGIAESGRRYYADHGVRLWGASANARIAKVNSHLPSPAGMLRRMKLAAWVLSRGYKSLAEAKEHLGSSYAYHAREELKRIRLRAYPDEWQFYREWGCGLTPEALGISIWDSAYSPTARKYVYDNEAIPPEWKAAVDQALKHALPLSREDWLRPQSPSPPRPRSHSRRRRQSSSRPK